MTDLERAEAVGKALGLAPQHATLTYGRCKWCDKAFWANGFSPFCYARLLHEDNWTRKVLDYFASQGWVTTQNDGDGIWEVEFESRVDEQRPYIARDSELRLAILKAAAKALGLKNE